jgi:hypothetical protein
MLLCCVAPLLLFQLAGAFCEQLNAHQQGAWLFCRCCCVEGSLESILLLYYFSADCSSSQA